MLAEGEVTTLELLALEAGFRTGELAGVLLRWSVGVGGVTVVNGVWRPALVGVLGVVLIGGRSLATALELLILFRADWEGTPFICDCRGRLLLFCLSVATMLPRGSPLSVDITEARSGLWGGLSAFFLELDLKTSLIRLAGETPRPSPLGSVSFVFVDEPG